MFVSKTVKQYKLICREEAESIGVPSTLVEIFLIKLLYSRKKKRYQVSEYLKYSALSVLLNIWKGPFKVLNDKSTPTFLFNDGTEVAIRSRRDSPAGYKWEKFIQDSNLIVSLDIKMLIKRRIKKRVEEVETGIIPAHIPF